MDVFGCCSNFIQCSDAGTCLHLSDPEYTGCQYRLNLEAGRVFYGNKIGTAAVAQMHDTKELDKSVFLHCLNRVFAIYKREGSYQLSWNLTPEQVGIIEEAFDEAGIPYKPEIDDLNECIIDYPSVEDPAPANSRVVFEVAGEEYHVLNFNSWLIKKAVAEKIAKALENHFIPARVELRGKYANVTRVEPFIPEIKPAQTSVKPVEMPKETAQDSSVEAKVDKYVQVSLFDTYTVGAKIPEARTEIPKIITLPVTAEPITGGSIVLAKDEYWGTYRGELIEVFITRTLQIIIGTKAKVRILETLKGPRQDAILNPKGIVDREPYSAGSIQIFDVENVSFVEVCHESLSRTG
jgi:hypothetical protein